MSDIAGCKLTRPFWLAAHVNYVQPTKAVSLSWLKTLSLESTRLVGWFMSMLQRLHCPRLETFVACNNRHWAPDGLYHFVRWSLMTIQTLDLSWCSIGLAGVEQLVTGDWPRLLELRLVHCELDVECVSWLTSCVFWPQLQLLDLSSNYLASDTMYVSKGQSLSLKLLTCHDMPLWLKDHWPHIQVVNLAKPQVRQ